MALIWILFGVLAVLAGLRHRGRLRAGRPSRKSSRIDDDAIETIIRTGTLPSAEEDAPLDMKAAAEAEEEFWAEPWDEPEEYRS